MLLALALSFLLQAQQPTPPRSWTDRVRNAVVHGEAGRYELLMLAQELDARASQEKSESIPRVVARVGLAALDSADEKSRELAFDACYALELEADPELGAELHRVAEACQQFLGPGKAEDFAAFACELLQPDAPFQRELGYDLAEFARLQGEFQRSLDRSAETVERFGAWSPLERSRALVWMGLGRLDSAMVHVQRAVDIAHGAIETWSAEVLALEFALMRQDSETVLTAVESALASEDMEQALGELAAVRRKSLEFFRLLARLELLRESPGEGREAEVRTSLARVRAFVLDPLERLRVGLVDSDLERLTHHPEAALQALAGLDLDVTEAGDEALLVPAYRWEALVLGSASKDDLHTAGEKVRVAQREMLALWSAKKPTTGGVAPLQIARRTELPSAAIDVELRLGGDDATERALMRLVELQAMGTTFRGSGARVPTLEEVRGSLLEPGRGALVLFPGQTRSHLFVLDMERVSHHELPARSALTTLARAVSIRLRDAQSEAPPELAELSARLLPAEVIGELKGLTGLVTVGFDQLGDVPFSALLVGQQPVGERFACTRLPSLPVGLLLAEKPASPSVRELTLVVVPDPGDAAVKRFDFDASRERSLRAPFQYDELLVGPGARRSALLERRDFSGSAITHFLAHGGFLRDAEIGAVLLLEPEKDGGTNHLRAEDVATLAFGPLVILSACGAGQGRQRLGDDVLQDLGGACLRAGARAVILTRFPVLDSDALELMVRVHAGLARGLSPAAALARALADLPGTPRQKFHASAFEVLGLGHEPVLKGSDRK